LWGSYFSRYRGRACKGVPSRFRARIEIEASQPIDPAEATRQLLREAVINLRSSSR
jgi:hypothetical protein